MNTLTDVFRHTGRRLAVRLFVALVICWWVLGIAFSHLWWLTNRHQLAWILFCYAWEVPAVGWPGIVLLPWVRWRTIGRRLAAGDQSWSHLFARYPQFVALCALLTSTLGYALGAVQLTLFAQLPMLETLKVIVQGPVLGLVFAAAAFLEAERATRNVALPADARLEVGGTTGRTAYWVAWKIRYITGTIALGAAIPIFLFGWTREQRRLEELRGLALQQALADQATVTSRVNAVEPLPSLGPHTMIYGQMAAVAPESAGTAVPLSPVRYASVMQVSGFWIDAPPQLFAADHGWYASRYGGHRVVAFQHLHGSTPSSLHPILLAVSPLADYGGPLGSTLWTAAAVCAVTLLVAFLLSLSFAQSVVEPLEAQSAEARALAGRLKTANTELRAAVHAAEAARHQAEAANRAKSDFLTTMSHELRTPLNAIRGYTELLDLGVRGALTKDQRADLHGIQRNEQHLFTVINDVLNLASLDAASMAYAIEDVPLFDLVTSTIDIVAPQLREKGLTLVIDPIDAACTAKGDSEKVRRIMVNLLSNAIKFTDRGGTISLSGRCEEAQTTLSVRDTGHGIPVHKLEAIFEPFVQVDSSLTRQAQGTGLGLAISRGLARGMHGDVTVESVLGAGSLFSLTLPRGGDQAVLARDGEAATAPVPRLRTSS